MSQKTIKEIERFKAQSESGKLFTVIIVQVFIINHDMATGQRSEIPGTKTATLSDGSKLKFIDDNHFEIYETETVITRV